MTRRRLLQLMPVCAMEPTWQPIVQRSVLTRIGSGRWAGTTGPVLRNGQEQINGVDYSMINGDIHARGWADNDEIVTYIAVAVAVGPPPPARRKP